MAVFGKIYLVALFALVFAGAASAIAISTCQQLNVPGATYTLSANIASANGTCINITAANVILNCQGRSITGANAAGSIGIYSNQAGTIVRRCMISGFMHGIVLNGATGATIGGSTANRNTVTTTMAQGEGIWVHGGSGNSIRNNIASATIGAGIFVDGGSTSNTLTANTASSSSWFGIQIGSDSDSGTSGNTLTNNIASSSGPNALNGIGLWNSNGNTLTGNTGTTSGNPGRGIYIIASNNNVLSNNIGRATNTANYIGVIGIDILWSSGNSITGGTADSQGGAAISIYGDATGAATGNTISGVTVTNPRLLVSISGPASGGNTFYQNRFDSASNSATAVYVNDTSTGNTWNFLVGGAQHGNYWYNVMNGPSRVQICDNTNPLNWGNNGAEYPYNAANSHGKFIGAGADSAPRTTVSGNC